MKKNLSNLEVPERNRAIQGLYPIRESELSYWCLKANVDLANFLQSQKGR
jgi:hypothetical protein